MIKIELNEIWIGLRWKDDHALASEHDLQRWRRLRRFKLCVVPCVVIEWETKWKEIKIESIR